GGRIHIGGISRGRRTGPTQCPVRGELIAYVAGCTVAKVRRSCSERAQVEGNVPARGQRGLAPNDSGSVSDLGARDDRGAGHLGRHRGGTVAEVAKDEVLE